MPNFIWVLVFGFMTTLCVADLAEAQGLQSSPYAAPSVLGSGMPGGSSPNLFDRSSVPGGFLTDTDSVRGVDSARKDIPNLQAGYVYYSAANRRAGYFTLDYILPVRVAENSVLFGEAHSEFQAYSTKTALNTDDQVYVSLGGGYRTLLRKNTLVGVNGFYDAARFANRWLSSGGAGVEMAAMVIGHDALDMNFNWYGDLSNEGSLLNEKRDGTANFELQAGYSHQLYDRGPDLRLFGTAYKFDDGTGVWGRQIGIELKSANGVFSAKCTTAFDEVNGSYQAVSAFINVGFHWDKLLKGKNPFVMPEPIFNSPRNMNRLTDTVKRHWKHATHGVALASTTQTITVWNKRSQPVKIYMGFIGAVGWGKYKASDFPGFTKTSCNPDNVLVRTLQPGEQYTIAFDTTKGQVSPAFSADTCTWQCTPTTPQTHAEFTLQGWKGDWVDISLVNGFNYPMEITSSAKDFTPIRVDAATGNKNKLGVFPLYCDKCNVSVVPGCTFPPDQSECSPDNNCQQTPPYGANYTVSIM